MRKYHSAFIRQAVELCKGRKNISELSRELGVQPHQLYRWRKEYDRLVEGSFPGSRTAGFRLMHHF